jgi:hypothetical protein
VRIHSHILSKSPPHSPTQKIKENKKKINKKKNKYKGKKKLTLFLHQIKNYLFAF